MAKKDDAVARYLQANRKGMFDDMRDDLPWQKPDEISKRVRAENREPMQLEADLRGDQGFLAFEQNRQKNLAKNRNRKYKPQKGRMKLLVCHSCQWKVRAAQSTIDRAKDAPCPACIREGVKTPGRLIQGD